MKDDPKVRTLKPTNIAFEIVFDEDQAKLGGLPIFGFAARVHYMRDFYQPPDDNPDFGIKSCGVHAAARSSSTLA